jgi:nitrogen fixation protein FixH
MKIRFTWPIGIVLALASFMIFILSYVYKATFDSKYDHHLVSDQYYKDELNYQKEIDEVNRGLNLKENITIIHENDGLLIKFPSEFDAKKIKGTIKFQRPSNYKLDFQLPINLTDKNVFISKKQLVEGIWKVKIDWNVDGRKFLFKQNITY